MQAAMVSPAGFLASISLGVGEGADSAAVTWVGSGVAVGVLVLFWQALNTNKSAATNNRKIFRIETFLDTLANRFAVCLRKSVALSTNLTECPNFTSICTAEIKGL